MKQPSVPFALLIPASLNTPEFLSAWADWVDERKVKRRALTERGAVLQLNKCSNWGVENSIASINRSIECGYVGLFEIVAQVKPITKTIMDKDLDAMDRKIIRL